MLKKIILSLGVIGSTFSTPVAAVEPNTYIMVPGMSIEYELPPHHPEVIINFFFWPITATCTIISDQQENPILFTALRKSGSVKNIPLSMGDSVELNFYPGEEVPVSADSGAKVELTNLSDIMIKANCASTN